MRGRVVICLLLSGTLGVVIWRWIAADQNTFKSADVRSNNSLSSLADRPASDANSKSSSVNDKSSPGLDHFGYRLSNTTRNVTELVRDPRAILLEDALLDTRLPLDMAFPAELHADGDPGCYIVQARNGLNHSFRQTLSRNGGTIVSYIPNQAYMVRLSSAAAKPLAEDPEVAAVLPYEPYYKIKPSLLQLVLAQNAPSVAQAGETPAAPSQPGLTETPDLSIKALLFSDAELDTLEQFKRAGIQISALDESPFGRVAQFLCSLQKVAWIARIPGVQEMELGHIRVPANDLCRATLGVAAGSVAPLNYLGLTGSNVLINVNDSGVDTNQPDLAGRVVWDVAASGVDNNGHGTHVAGIIAGSGSKSLTVTNAPGSSMPPVALQFRGLAPAARILSISVTNQGNAASDTYLQQAPAQAAALISNNSWHYADDADYDLGAASFDAAVRDALPGVSGAQPLLIVFAAGNAGKGAKDGTGGIPDSIQSPGTAKNVITVGALEQPRFITNQTWTCTSNGNGTTCQTNTPWLPLTDSSNQVASFSSRGNVGLGVEGLCGRFKPDVVAPGTFLASTRSTTWDQVAYYSASNNFLNLATDANSAQVLSNLNNGLGPFYRFESGTSLGAAAVSGTLALMQEFFEGRLGRTNSPALMKALLINGARSLGSGFDLHSPGATNSQGWGVVQLPNSLPGSLTNPPATGTSMLLFDQDPDDALATSQQRTRFVSVTPGAQNLPLRITLAWTDPPGNPVAGLKLVNDLDLIVTNLQTGQVFWGNDIPARADFSSAWQPASTPNRDLVNNVENVYLAPSLGSNYSVTVLARRVGVNAVTKHPNGIVQDYALVISSGDGQIANALSISDGPTVSAVTPNLTFVTNSFASGVDYGGLLLHQRVGANTPLLGINTIPSPISTNSLVTIGTSNQWQFYVFTNATSFTNAVFLTFAAQSLAMLPGTGGEPGVTNFAYPWSADSDVDLYVSQNPGLTNLDPVALSQADVSFGRGGSEVIIYSNAVSGVYYVGVKCESQQGADYGFLADVSDQPFAQTDSQGNELLRGFPGPTSTASGTPAQPSQAYTFFVTPDSFPVRRVIVTNMLSYASPIDLQTSLSHASASVVLHNHSTNGLASAIQTFVYDDSYEGDIPGALPSDGPGTLRQFYGHDGGGQWMMNLQTTNQPATNQAASLFLERQQNLLGAETANILPGVCREDFLFVPALFTNATTTASLASGTGPISLEVYPAGVSGSNCATLLIAGSSASGSLTVDQFSQPPLNPGLYVVRTCNLGPDTVSVSILSTIVSGPAQSSPSIYSSDDPAVIPDDSLSVTTLSVTNTNPILLVDVGVRIDHPRISDLVLSLVGPDGTRVLLEAGRGGVSTNGMGANVVVTNTTPVSFSGGPEAVTNVFDTGETSGMILISYDFFALPDEMRVYYEGKLLYDSGLVSLGGGTNISYGPGTSTEFTIVMNQGGNSESNTSWFYSVTSTRIEPQYFTFTENTNLTVTPVKFAPTPLTNLTVAPEGLSAPVGIFYLPEEPLSRFAGKNPFGQWQLEILDTRAGATSPPPRLVSWQLAFTLADPVPTPVPLSAFVPSTNLVAPGQIQWYEVDAPDWVSSATNSLLSATGPINLLFNQIVPPTGTNAGDQLLGLGSSTGNWILRTNAVPGLVPGSGYFLGVQNTNSSTVTVVFEVGFDVVNMIALSSGVPYANTNLGPLNSSDYYRYVVSTNAVRLQFEVNAPTSDVTLVARKGLPLPNLGSYDFASANPGTNDELIVLYDYSRPVFLSAGEWFLAVINITGSPVAYSILATEFTVYGTNILVSEAVTSSNQVCLTWNSVLGIHYFVEGKAALEDATWTSLSPTITASDVTTTFCVPTPTPFQYFRVLEGLALVPALPILSSVGWTANGTLLQWSAPTNLIFNVQWSASVASAHWQSIPGTVTSTNGSFLFLDDGSRTGGLGKLRFYRLAQLP